MDTRYHIAVNIRTPEGMLEVGKFYLGTDHGFAHTAFSRLRGIESAAEYPAIRLDLLGTPGDELPVCLKSIICTLDEYTENCRIITREAFRHFMFDAPVDEGTLGVL